MVQGALAAPEQQCAVHPRRRAEHERERQRDLHPANTQPTVALTVSGLEPGSQHAAFVSQGTCQNQSTQKVFGLQPLTADSSGNATSTTVIGNVQSTPSTAWYIIITRGTNLSSFIDAAPIACGPVLVSQ
jgi:hypothetical protein